MFLVFGEATGHGCLGWRLWGPSHPVSLVTPSRPTRFHAMCNEIRVAKIMEYRGSSRFPGPLKLIQLGSPLSGKGYEATLLNSVSVGHFSGVGL